MNRLIILALVLLLFSCKEKQVAILQIEGDTIATIAFGSCNKQDKKQILWDDVANDQPDLWVWLGDNIYGDISDPEVMQSKYEMQKSNEDYQSLIRTIDIYGIWDDHDFGKNDGGKEFEAKDTMRDLMFDFLDVPRDNPAWGRKGAYQSYDLTINDLEVKLILLDSRYFRDEAPKSGGLYVPNLDGTILGEEQWLWLEQELSNVESDLLLVGNGIQVLPEEHKYEKWANFPNERKRLISLLAKNGIPPTILLSGDRHLTEVSKLEQEKVIYEVTSSGMTHTYSNFVSEANKYRVGKVVADKSYGLLRVFKSGTDNRYVVESKGDDGEIYQRIELSY
jgi:alkaline phosphatase D